MRKTRTVYILTLALFLAPFLWIAAHDRQELIDQYNQGVQYYENEEYKEAMEVFNNLRGWGRRRDISPEDYYEMALEKLTANGADIVVCPHCGALMWKWMGILLWRM